MIAIVFGGVAFIAICLAVYWYRFSETLAESCDYYRRMANTAVEESAELVEVLRLQYVEVARLMRVVDDSDAQIRHLENWAYEPPDV